MAGTNQALRNGKEKSQSLGGAPSQLLPAELAGTGRVATPRCEPGSRKFLL